MRRTFLSVLSISLLVASAANATGAVDWTLMPHTTPWSAGCGWNSLFYDTLKHRILFMAIEPNEGDDIYAHTLWAYDTVGNQMTRLGGGTNSAGQLINQDTCPQAVTPSGNPWADDTPTWPGPRHPYHQMAWDPKRNRLWLMGGVCSGYDYPDTYYYDSAAESWTQLHPPHYPVYRAARTMIYDSDTDALLLYGYDGGAATHNLWIYCPGDASGVLSARQMQAGCMAADDWFEVFPNNGTVNVDGTSVTLASGAPFNPAWQIGFVFIGTPDNGTSYTLASVTSPTQLTLGTSLGTQTGVPYYVEPPWTQPGMVYDLVTRKVILFGGGGNQTWTYDVAAKIWLDQSPANPPPEDPYFPEPTIAYNSSTGQLLYHQRTGVGGPADWSYDPANNTWAIIAAGGGWYIDDAAAQASPNATAQVMVHDPIENVLVTWRGTTDVWQGRLEPPAPLAPQIYVQPSSDPICIGDNASFTVYAIAYPAPSYQWQSKTSADWMDIPGATAATYRKMNLAAMDNGMQLRCVITNPQGSATTNPIALSVIACAGRPDGGAPDGSAALASESGGCGCVIARARGATGAPALLFVLACALALRRRR
jgi:hypothetical protein